jgi:oxygen-independent coproporphyrinogen-3 oxidase
MVAAMLAELDMQAAYLSEKTLGSVYFGGGTPSLLELRELEQIFSKINSLYRLDPGAEITLEANPDDLTTEKLRDLKNYTPVNRLSIGIQSFDDTDLQWMNRAHSARHARACLDDALATGFDDLSIDLIYGAPPTSDTQWADNLRIAFEYKIPHLSCYCLTVEEGTALGTFVRRGQQPPVDEEKAARQFEYLTTNAAAQGYDHYEISNFALPGRHARHNSSYWFGEPYLGIGPSAHSFDGASRQWNIANNALYIKAIAEGRLPFEREVLTTTQRYNEYIMTSLRTMWGVDPKRIAQIGAGFEAYFLQAVRPFCEQGQVEEAAGKYRLTAAGKFLADGIAAELFRSADNE